jgi:hypothetical protein
MTNYVAQVKNNETLTWESWEGVSIHECLEEANQYLQNFLSFMEDALSPDEPQIDRNNYRIVKIEKLLVIAYKVA